MATVDFRNVHKIFPLGVHAVRDLSLNIDDGELVVLVGPSGCGKTTTLRMLAGLEDATAGEIRIGNQRVNELQPVDRDVAMVFQNQALFPHLTVRQNLGFGLKMRRTDKGEVARRVDAAAQALGIASLLDRRPRELSGGQRQRVALGRAMVRQPRAFLFDEPLSHLDPPLRVQLRGELAALHRRLGATMIYVTHDQVEAMTLGQRIAVMNRGVVHQMGSPAEIYHAPANRFVAGFMGSPPMNFLQGEVAEKGFRYAGGVVPLSTAVPSGLACLGVRPEDVTLDGAGPMLPAVTVESVELLGYEVVAYFDLCETRWSLRGPNDDRLRVGGSIQPKLRQDRWHLFAVAECGVRIG